MVIAVCLAALLMVAGCGGGGGQDNEGPVTVSTLAYVVSECHEDLIRQSLQVRQGEQPPITVVEHSAAVPTARCVPPGSIRQGPAFAELGVFRRLGVTPDASQVVFEVTDDVTDFVDYPLAFPPHALPEDQKGIFAVDADGGNVRRLGDASREPVYFLALFTFSPDGRTIAYTDRGPSDDNEDAVQIVTLDLVTRERRQVTHLPPSGQWPGTYQPFFNDEQTITFSTHADADGGHPGGKNIVVTVNTDGSMLTVAPPVTALPGAEILKSFRITGSELDTAVLTVPGTAVNPEDGFFPFNVQEVFDIDRGNNILQLTNFGRVDTYRGTVSPDAQRVLFTASANPPGLGTNPDHGCQVFSIDRNGADLRQLTNFHEVPEGQQARGCGFWPRGNGCSAAWTDRDIRTDGVMFYSTCDPFGTNLVGAQVFAMRADGTGLRQLTNTQGLKADATGTTVELPFPFAWPGLQIRNQF